MNLIVLVVFLIVAFSTQAEQSTVELEPITVTGSSVKQVETSHLLPLRVVSSQEINKVGVKTINDLLKYLPEIDFTQVEPRPFSHEQAAERSGHLAEQSRRHVRP